MQKVDRFYFASSQLAWRFLRECEKAGITTGFPALKPNEAGDYEVQTRPQDAETAEPIARAVRGPAGRLRALGYEPSCMGGNCMAYVKRLDGERRAQVYNECLWLPEEGDELEVFAGTLGPDDEEPADLRTFTTLAECVAALEAEQR